MRPFRSGFLDAVFAEIALARLDQRLNFLGAAALANRDQGNVARFAARKLARFGNAVANIS